MKTNLRALLVGLALLAGIHEAAAQAAQFFRIVGPAATKIIAFRPDGTLVWTNARPATNYTIQTASSLSGGPIWVDYVQLPVTSARNTNQIIDPNPPAGMALIPAGVFTMGDTSDFESDAIPTNVTVSSFYMDTNLVTLSLWQSVYSYATNRGYGFTVGIGYGTAANQPEVNLFWYDCVKWCNARSQQAGLMPVYYTNSGLTQVYKTGDVDAVYANWGANGYRLPTEAEWEKAARGGVSGRRFPWGDTISESQANYQGDTGDFIYDWGPNGYNTNFETSAYVYTSPVGYFAPNGYGLYDMAGNVLEWCWDWYGTPLGQPTTTNPTGAGPGSGFRVLRGGGWDSHAVLARCASRWFLSAPNYAYDDAGFRCVRRQ